MHPKIFVGWDMHRFWAIGANIPDGLENELRYRYDETVWKSVEEAESVIGAFVEGFCAARGLKGAANVVIH